MQEMIILENPRTAEVQKDFQAENRACDPSKETKNWGA